MPEATASISQRSEAPSCSICHDRGTTSTESSGGYRTSHTCACAEPKRIAREFQKIPERFRSCTFETFIPKNEVQRATLATMQSKPLGNYMLIGAYGMGKTHLIHGQFKALVTARVDVRVRTAGQLFSDLRAAEMGDSFQRLEWTDPFEKNNRYHLLCDDLDKSRFTEFRNESLFEVVDLIYRREYGLTITANMDLVQLQALGMMPATARRIDAMCQILRV